MALDITTLADAVAASLAAFDWGEAKNVHREWLDVNDLKALATLTVLVTPESRLSASLTRDRYRQELRIEVVVQKRVGPAAAAKAEIDGILTKFDAAAEALRMTLAGAFPLPPEWPVIASPELLHEGGLLFSVMILRWAKQ
jgi:hypothetical protein